MAPTKQKRTQKDKTQTTQRRRLSPDQRREELIEAAEKLIRVKGETCRVEDIVAAAGAAKGTFYLYFSSWEDLLFSLRQRAFENFNLQYPIPQQSKRPVDWMTILEKVAVGFVDFVIELGGIHRVVFHGPFADNNPVAEGFAAEGPFVDILKAGMAARTFKKSDPEITAHLLFAMVHSAADAVSHGQDRSQILKTMRLLLRRSLQ